MRSVLDSALGVRLLLWTGSPVPTPSPTLLPSLRSVEVRNDVQSGDGFQLSFALTKDAYGRYDVLGDLPTGTRVWIGAIIGAAPEALIDGIVERHDFAPGDQPGETTLTATGSSVLSAMGLEEKDQPHPNQPDHLIVSKILLSYAEYGLVPAVTPTTDIPIEIRRIPQQRETDLAYIKRLADANGFAFYSEPITFGVNRAYWGPEIRAGVPQKALTLGLGPHRNCSRLSFSFDALAPAGATGTVVEPITKMKIPIPPLPPLRVPPLSSSPAPALRTTRLREAANVGPLQATLASAAAATRAPDAVSAQGTLDTARYGRVLRARRPVGVRGAGLEYDGFYYVTSVTHSISRDDYTQSFSLSRDGTGTLSPVVIP